MNRIPGLLLLALAVIGGSVARSRFTASVARRAAAPDAAALVARERRVRDQDIAFYAARVARDPSGAIDLARLGGLYLARHRETGSASDLALAESAALRSAGNRGTRNPAAWQVLAASRIARHRFVDALTAVEQVLAGDPDNAGARAAKGEILLELGRYPEADRLFTGLTLRRTAPGIAPRYARWLELRGRAGRASRLLEEARIAAANDLATPREQLAWFDLRLAELALKFEDHREAVRWADSGLALVPDDARLLSTKARALLGLGRPEQAVRLADSALGIRFDVATLIVLASSWEQRGDTALAGEYRRILAANLAADPANVHRGWSLFVLDHGGNADSIATVARDDVKVRPDTYGFDLYAWALYRAGHIAEAAAAMHRARAAETEDPLLDRHAAAIAAAARAP